MGILRKLEYDTLIEIIEHFEKKYPVLILINFDTDWYKYHILIECIREDCVRRHYTERLTTIDISLEDSPEKIIDILDKELKKFFPAPPTLSAAKLKANEEVVSYACPHCGAAISSLDKCDFCGAKFCIRDKD